LILDTRASFLPSKISQLQVHTCHNLMSHIPWCDITHINYFRVYLPQWRLAVAEAAAWQERGVGGGGSTVAA
jgi:hypothetical protein